MGTENIETILEKLDNLETQNERLHKMFEDMRKEIFEVEITNGGGRKIKFKRAEFFQMLYDKQKETFNNLSESARKYGNIIDIFIKLAMIVTLVAAIIKIGG